MTELNCRMFPVARLKRWEKNPRKNFRPGPLKELGESIRSKGVILPLVVRPIESEDGQESFQIIAGERRWRASELVGVTEVPILVRDLSDKDAIEVAVTENVDRENFDRVEEADGYFAMQEFGWTQNEIAERNGKSQSYVSMLIKLVDLEEPVKAALREEKISYTTAASLRSVSEEKRLDALSRVVDPGDGLGALPEKMAVARIRREFIEPEKLAKKWEKMAAKIRRCEPGMKVLDYWESMALLAAEWRGIDERPGEKELAVHARDWPEDSIPTWSDLAAKHGGETVVTVQAKRVAGTDGEWSDELLERRVVRIEPLMEAERAAHEEKPEDCVFPILGGKGRHQQSMVKQKAGESVKKRQRDLGKVAADLVGRWFHSWTHPVDGKKPAEVEKELPGVGQWFRACGGFPYLDEVAESLAVDLVALGDGDATAGRAKWVESLVDRRGWRAVVFLMGAGVLTGCVKENPPETAEQIMKKLQEALKLVALDDAAEEPAA